MNERRKNGYKNKINKKLIALHSAIYKLFTIMDFK
jgi:hypothetical protein